MRREVFDEVGGFDDEHLAVSFNDVDFCIRVREAGYRIIWTPGAELYHYESISRGRDETPPWDVDEWPDFIPEGRRGYRAMISQIDDWVGRIVAAVDARGELDRTLFIYTADHGEMAGDHSRR